MNIRTVNLAILMALLVGCTTTPFLSSPQSADIADSQARSDGSCMSALGLGFIANGGTVSGYATSMSVAGTPCSISTVSCTDGSLNGPDLYPSCSDINQDCPGVPNGGSVSGYTSSVAPCTMTTVTCTNGSLSGPQPFPTCSE